MELTQSFQDKTGQGISDFYQGVLKAQDNPEFLTAYKQLLAKNDRVICMDRHAEDAGKEFMASDKHMSMLKQAGYKFHLIEYDPRFNEIIEDYEKDKADINELQREMSAFQMSFFLQDPQIKDLIKSKEITIQDVEREADKFTKSLTDAVENGKANGIKVRFFDDASVIGQDADEKDENSHIDDPILRRDDSWDPYIEAMTKGAKATLFIGAGHVATSYGIDEYMEARGYKVGTFLISEELSLEDGDVTPQDNYLKFQFDQVILYDRDGYDPSDFVPGLFYHDQNSTIEYRKQKEDLLPDPEDSSPTQPMPDPVEIKGPGLKGFSA